jgi:hypothetical protein
VAFLALFLTDIFPASHVSSASALRSPDSRYVFHYAPQTGSDFSSFLASVVYPLFFPGSPRVSSCCGAGAVPLQDRVLLPSSFF